MLSPLRSLPPLLLLCGWGAVLLLPANAAADKISDAMAECRGKAEGEACALAGRKGACVARSFERPNGMSKRWVECAPGKSPDRRPVEKQVDAAGPVGVLPSVGAVEDDVETREAEGSAAAPSAPVGAPERGAEEVDASALRATPATPSSSSPADAPSPKSKGGEDPAEARGAAPASQATETRGGCRMGAPTPPLGLALGLLALLVIAGRRREPQARPRDD